MADSSSSAPIHVILVATIICGVLDIVSALILNKLRGNPPKRLLQMIPSALIGPRSFEGGNFTAAVGLCIHFFIAFTASTIYYLASRRFPMLIDHPVLFGMLYGIAVHLFMTFIVLPLSALKRSFSMKAFLTQLIVHMFFVGLPIALVIRHYERTAVNSPAGALCTYDRHHPTPAPPRRDESKTKD